MLQAMKLADVIERDPRKTSNGAVFVGTSIPVKFPVAQEHGDQAVLTTCYVSPSDRLAVRTWAGFDLSALSALRNARIDCEVRPRALVLRILLPPLGLLGSPARLRFKSGSSLRPVTLSMSRIRRC